MLKLHSFRSVLRLFWIVTVYYFQKGSVCGLVSGRRVDGGRGGRCWCKINLASFLFHWGRLRQFFFFFSNRICTWRLFLRFVKKPQLLFLRKGWIKLFWGTLIRIRCFSSETLHLSLKLWACNLIFKLQLFFLSSDYKLWLISTISNSQALCKLIYSDYPFLTSFPFKIRIIRVNPVSWLK